MSVSKVKKPIIKDGKVSDRLLEIGKDYLAGHTLSALTDLSNVGPVQFSDAFYILDKLGPFLNRREQRQLLDLLTEVVVLSQSDIGMSKHILRDYMKKRIRNSGNFGEFVYHVIQQVNGLQHT